jgi:hypothetical protein
VDGCDTVVGEAVDVVAVPEADVVDVVVNTVADVVVDNEVVVDGASAPGGFPDVTVAVEVVGGLVVTMTPLAIDDVTVNNVDVGPGVASWRSATVAATSTIVVVTASSIRLASSEATVHAVAASAANGMTIIVHPRCATRLVRPLSSLRCIRRQHCAINITP